MFYHALVCFTLVALFLQANCLLGFNGVAIHRLCSLEFQLLRVVLPLPLPLSGIAYLAGFYLYLYIFLSFSSFTHVRLHSFTSSTLIYILFSTMVSKLIVAVLGVYKVKNNEY